MRLRLLGGLFILCLPIALLVIFWIIGGRNTVDKSGPHWQLPPYEELTNAPGVSIRYIPNPRGSNSSSRSGSFGTIRTFNGIYLENPLRQMSTNPYPIHGLNLLPTHRFDITIKSSTQSQNRMLAKLMQGYSQAFGLRVTLETRRRPVSVLTCPDPAKLIGLVKTTGSRMNPIDAGRLRGDVDFSGTMGQFVRVFNESIATDLVDETKLTDQYRFRLVWNESAGPKLHDALRAMGLEVTSAEREIKAIYIEKQATQVPEDHFIPPEFLEALPDLDNVPEGELFKVEPIE